MYQGVCVSGMSFVFVCEDGFVVVYGFVVLFEHAQCAQITDFDNKFIVRKRKPIKIWLWAR